jgi:hypothetical protein
MNERIKLLAEQAEKYADYNFKGEPFWSEAYESKLAELIVRECKENFAKVWYKQGVDCRGAELDKFMAQFDQHFGVEETSAQAEQEAAAFIAAENKKVASRYGYVPKLHPSEWKD